MLSVCQLAYSQILRQFFPFVARIALTPFLKSLDTPSIQHQLAILAVFNAQKLV